MKNLIKKIAGKSLIALSIPFIILGSEGCQPTKTSKLLEGKIMKDSFSPSNGFEADKYDVLIKIPGKENFILNYYGSEARALNLKYDEGDAVKVEEATIVTPGFDLKSFSSVEFKEYEYKIF